MKSLSDIGKKRVTNVKQKTFKNLQILTLIVVCLSKGCALIQVYKHSYMFQSSLSKCLDFIFHLRTYIHRICWRITVLNKGVIPEQAGADHVLCGGSKRVEVQVALAVRPQRGQCHAQHTVHQLERLI